MAIYQVGTDGKAPKEAKVGDYVVTGGGTYKIGSDGKGQKVTDKNDAYYTNSTRDIEQVGRNYATLTGANKPSINQGVTYTTKNENPYTPSRNIDTYNPYESMAKEYEQKYKDLLKQQQQANQLAVNQGVQRLESQKHGINQGYDNTARQAYILSMQQQQAQPQTLAAQGINGGATETSKMMLDTAYQNNVNEINQKRQNDLLGIDNAILDLKNTGDINSANMAYENALKGLDTYTNLMENKMNQDREDFTYSIGANYNDLAAYANLLKAQGSPQWQIDAVLAERQQKIKELNLDQQGRPLEQTYVSADPSYATALQAYNKGIRTPQVLRILGLA